MQRKAGFFSDWALFSLGLSLSRTVIELRFVKKAYLLFVFREAGGVEKAFVLRFRSKSHTASIITRALSL